MLGKDERVFQAFALVFDLWNGVCNTLYLESDCWLSEAYTEKASVHIHIYHPIKFKHLTTHFFPVFTHVVMLK